MTPDQRLGVVVVMLPTLILVLAVYTVWLVWTTDGGRGLLLLAAGMCTAVLLGCGVWLVTR